MPATRVVVVDDGHGFDLAPVVADLAGIGLGVDVRPPPWAGAPPERLAPLAERLARAKVRRPDRPVPPDWTPFPIEVQGEARALAGTGRPPGPIYDGALLMRAWLDALPTREARFDAAPLVVVTDRLIGTFEGARYHVRFLVAGHPSVVSVPGFVDGPARDRSYYVARQLVGLDAGLLATDDHVTMGDPRLPTCVASAILQAVAHHATGDAFCTVPTCRLANAHWQRELVAGMAAGRTCARHTAPTAGATSKARRRSA